MELGPTKGGKKRVVEFGDTLAALLKRAHQKQLHKQLNNPDGIFRNYCAIEKDKGRLYYFIYSAKNTDLRDNYLRELEFVCAWDNGKFVTPNYLENMCRKLRDEIPELGRFTFHALRQTYTSNLLELGARPIEVQELLGHSDVRTTLQIYAHTTKETRRSTAKLLDKIGKKRNNKSL